MRYIAFLRGINVSGQKLIKMEALREYFQLPGFKNIVTYIQSGNVLFDTNAKDEEALRKKIEKQLQAKTGHQVTVVLRTVDEMREVISGNPFKNVAPDDSRKLYITFLSQIPDRSLHSALDTYAGEGEEFHINGREVYILTGGYADTKFSNTFIEKKLRVAATTRNWATVNKVIEL
jgi:uncharacterized protein (DUF1697 family)